MDAKQFSMSFRGKREIEEMQKRLETKQGHGRRHEENEQAIEVNRGLLTPLSKCAKTKRRKEKFVTIWLLHNNQTCTHYNQIKNCSGIS